MRGIGQTGDSVSRYPVCGCAQLRQRASQRCWCLRVYCRGDPEVSLFGTECDGQFIATQGDMKEPCFQSKLSRRRRISDLALRVSSSQRQECDYERHVLIACKSSRSGFSLSSRLFVPYSLSLLLGRVVRGHRCPRSPLSALLALPWCLPFGLTQQYVHPPCPAAPGATAAHTLGLSGAAFPLHNGTVALPFCPHPCGPSLRRPNPRPPSPMAATLPTPTPARIYFGRD